MKKYILFLIIFFFSAGTASAQLADTPWPTFHGNQQRTGLSPYDTSHVDGTIKWSYELGAGTEASPTIGPDGTIYIGAHDGYVYAVKEGVLKWKTKIGTPQTKHYGGDTSYTSIMSAPTIDKDGNLYMTSRDQYFYSLDSNGNINWKYQLNFSPDHWGSAAIAEDGTIYINASPPDENFYEVDGSIYITENPPEGGLYAFNPDGTKKWHFYVSQRMFNSPTIGKDGTIYIAVLTSFDVTEVIAINPNGTKKWSVDTPLEIESSPAIGADGTVYVGSFAKDRVSAGLYAINEQGIKWYLKVGGKEVLSTPAIGADGTIYFGSDNRIYYAANPNGTLKWSFDPKGSIESSTAIGADGTLYFATNPDMDVKTNFYALNPNGTLKWSFTPEQRESSPVSPAIGADGTVYHSSWGGTLYAFSGSPSNTVVKKSIEETGICPLARRKAYKHTASNSVYYITNDCTKRAFTKSIIFFTYFSYWTEVQTVPKSWLDVVKDDALGFMPYGPKYDPKYGALIKITSDPKVYLLLGDEKYWITSESVFNALKYQWNWIEDVDERLLDKYSIGSEITDITKHPNFTLVKYADSPDVYRLENGMKRLIVDEASFNKLNFRWDRIVTIDLSETYPDGLELK